MIKVSICSEDWSVSATVHDEDVGNLFEERNKDKVAAYAILHALGLASYNLWNPFYVLAKVVMLLDQTQIHRLQAAEDAFMAAAEEYCRIAEEILEQKETQHG